MVFSLGCNAGSFCIVLDLGLSFSGWVLRWGNNYGYSMHLNKILGSGIVFWLVLSIDAFGFAFSMVWGLSTDLSRLERYELRSHEGFSVKFKA